MLMYLKNLVISINLNIFALLNNKTEQYET